MEDCEILDLYFARDESAIRETDKKYGRYCHYIAYHILESEEDAKEIVSETYLKAWNTIPPRRPDPLKHYVGTISRRTALDRYERVHAEKRGGQMARLTEELSDCVTGGELGIGESVALGEALNRFVRALPSKPQRIFIRRYWYAATIAEIAEAYGMAESAVTVSLTRTRQKLRTFLEKEGFVI